MANNLEALETWAAVLLERLEPGERSNVTAIAAVLQQSTAFNSMVREQIEGMDISARFMDITQRFTSIREDAAAMLAGASSDVLSRMRPLVVLTSCMK